MYRRRSISGKKGERGVVILVVALVLLFVVGAMAVLAIDFVSFYTARSEAQLAADSAALAGARVLANSGVTSNPADSGLTTNARAMAQVVATQVAASNKVGGRTLNPATEVNVTFTGSSAGGGGGGLSSNPRVTVRVTRTDLPTFFARIWGRTQLTLTATATAEAYNPSGLNIAAGDAPPVAPICVKPWVLPNLDPRYDTATAIFAPATGAINDTTLLGWTDAAASQGHLRAACTGSCTSLPNPTSPLPEPDHWVYYAGAQSSFPPPTQALPTTCGIPLDAYQDSIVGCVSTPIACNSNVTLDHQDYFPRNQNGQLAANCLTHAENNKGDRVTNFPPGQAFQFIGGDDNPVAGAQGKNVMISDSLVTVPVFDIPASWPPPSYSVQVIGFVQLFLNPDGNAAPTIPVSGGPPDPMKSAIVNLIGCGKNASGQPIIGNGASPVAVRLVSSGS